MTKTTCKLFTVHSKQTGVCVGIVAKRYGSRGGYKGSWYLTPEGTVKANERILDEHILHQFNDRSEYLGVLFGLERFLDQNAGCDVCEATKITVRKQRIDLEGSEIE